MYSKFPFGEVCSGKYGRKFSFMATREGSHKMLFPNVYPTIYSYLPNKKIENGCLHSDALLQFELKLERCRLHKAACHPTKCDVINDVKLFRTVYSRIFSCTFMTLSNQTSRYKLKYIRMTYMFCVQ